MRLASLFVTASLFLCACAGKVPARIATTAIAAFGGFAVYHGATMDTTGASFEDASEKTMRAELCVAGGLLVAGVAAAVFIHDEVADGTLAPASPSW